MRYWKPLLFSLYMLTSAGFLKATDIRLGLFYGHDIRSIVFSVVKGEYILSGNGRTIAVIRKGTMFHIGLTGTQMTVQDTMQMYGTFTILEFKGTSVDNIFQVKPVLPSMPSKESDDNLTMGIRENAIQVINILDLEKYLPGTIEEEGGPNARIEFYKAQAVLVRTFAVKNFTRHANEGFNLCDGVHCQAFNGKSRMNPVIYKATLETADTIVADMSGNPITAAYHANCGGITSSASMAWNKDLPYLVAIHDPFCDGSSRRNWSKSMPLSDWNGYLEGKGLLSGSAVQLVLTGTGRQKFLSSGKWKIPLTVIREDLNLKSSFFTLEPSNAQMIINGHGYGHGVGMCQEGAMEMARVGYSYVDILMFYFHKVKLQKR